MRTAATFLFLSSATLALAALPSVKADAGQEVGQIGTGGVSAQAQCAAEAAAYSDVADLAYSYRAGGDIFADALFDLREQLLDCLATTDTAPDDGSVLPGDVSRRSI